MPRYPLDAFDKKAWEFDEAAPAVSFADSGNGSGLWTLTHAYKDSTNNTSSPPGDLPVAGEAGLWDTCVRLPSPDYVGGVPAESMLLSAQPEADTTFDGDFTVIHVTRFGAIPAVSFPYRLLLKDRNADSFGAYPTLFSPDPAFILSAEYYDADEGVCLLGTSFDANLLTVGRFPAETWVMFAVVREGAVWSAYVALDGLAPTLTATITDATPVDIGLDGSWSLNSDTPQPANSIKFQRTVIAETARSLQYLTDFWLGVEDTLEQWEIDAVEGDKGLILPQDVRPTIDEMYWRASASELSVLPTSATFLAQSLAPLWRLYDGKRDLAAKPDTGAGSYKTIAAFIVPPTGTVFDAIVLLGTNFGLLPGDLTLNLWLGATNTFTTKRLIGTVSLPESGNHVFLCLGPTGTEYERYTLDAGNLLQITLTSDTALTPLPEISEIIFSKRVQFTQKNAEGGGGDLSWQSELGRQDGAQIVDSVDWRGARSVVLDMHSTEKNAFSGTQNATQLARVANRTLQGRYPVVYWDNPATAPETFVFGRVREYDVQKRGAGQFSVRAKIEEIGPHLDEE